MVEEPHVRTLAGRLASCLDPAGPPGAGGQPRRA
jgi:hypothetical protein